MSTLSERLRDNSGSHINGLYDREAADELDRLTARADALEAALREVLAAQENYAKCHMAEENAINNYSGGQAAYSRATIAALARVSEAEKSARSLLEKTNDR